VGLDRSKLLRDLGVTVVALPLEIHPEIPVGGLSLAERWGARYGEAVKMYERIEAECRAAGLPFNRPARVPNTRRALATHEWARRRAPDAALALEQAIFEAHFVDNRPLDDPDVLDELVEAAGADSAEARRAVDAGELDGAVASALAAARSLGIDATPTWLIDGRVLVPGAVARDLFRSAVNELQDSGAGEG
jgi:predicted DsbA family dithiol-disulfide isomerase